MPKREKGRQIGSRIELPAPIWLGASPLFNATLLCSRWQTKWIPLLYSIQNALQLHSSALLL